MSSIEVLRSLSAPKPIECTPDVKHLIVLSLSCLRHRHKEFFSAQSNFDAEFVECIIEGCGFYVDVIDWEELVSWWCQKVEKKYSWELPKDARLMYVKLISADHYDKVNRFDFGVIGEGERLDIVQEARRFLLSKGK